ncbi:MAG: hypothetical protein OIF50_08440 [Flavobacteriaceae bacterium]|nr:hypothetical protein [Flavobacteriaceae bacterium]
MEATALLEHFLPEGLLEYFEISAVKQAKDKLTLVLEEKPLPKEEQSSKGLHSKGFYPTVQIQDFPIQKLLA